MILIQCTRCGSKELFEESGYTVCAYCRSRFFPQPDEIPRRESVISVHSDIQNLLLKCREDPANRVRYASLVLDIDPTNTEAIKYLR